KHAAFYNRACAHSLNHNPEAALQDLATALQLAPEENRGLAHSDQDFANLHEDPRFWELLGPPPLPTD
ncbi:MAG: hypothetical protein B0A82_05045, partial [Alkalinema sp. CACIAM 70d]